MCCCVDDGGDLHEVEGGQWRLQVLVLICSANCSLRAHHHDFALRRNCIQHVSKVAQVSARGGTDLVAHSLSVLIGVANDVAHHGREALGVRQLVRVQVTEGADDRLGDVVLGDICGAQVCGGSIVVLEGFDHVRVAVRQERQHARTRIESAESAVGAALYAHCVPQVCRRQHILHHKRGAVELVSEIVHIGALGHVVHLGGNHEALEAGAVLRGPGDAVGRHRGRRQRRQEGGQLRPQRLVAVVVVSDAHKHGFGVDESVVDGAQLRQHLRPVGVDLDHQLAHELQERDAAHLLSGPVGGIEQRRQPRRRQHVSPRNEAALDSSLLLQEDLLEPLLVVQLHVRQHVAYYVQHLSSLRAHGLGAQDQVRLRRPAFRASRRQGGCADSAGFLADALVERNKVARGGAHLQQRPRK
mmetsp:Transcript_26326/g.45271  ORF Transcript_26326/g.45271 Transcript_26326/m.45271 type:complete len:414 (-) Transcript_26326:2125-3366(-)